MIRFAGDFCLFAGKPGPSSSKSNSPIYFLKTNEILPKTKPAVKISFKKKSRKKKQINFNFKDSLGGYSYSPRHKNHIWKGRAIRTMTDLSFHKHNYLTVPRRHVFSSNDLGQSKQIRRVKPPNTSLSSSKIRVPALPNPIDLHLPRSQRVVRKESSSPILYETKNEIWGASKNCFTAFLNDSKELVTVAIEAELTNFIIFENFATKGISISDHVSDEPLFLEFSELRKSILCAGNSKSIYEISISDLDTLKLFGNSRHNQEVYMMKIIFHGAYLAVSGDSKFVEIFNLKNGQFSEIIRLSGECYDFGFWKKTLVIYDEGFSGYRILKFH